MTRNEVLGLRVGDAVQFCWDMVPGARAHHMAKWSEPREVTSIFAQEVSSHHGKAYVCFYTQFGPHSTVSGSCREGEEYYRLAR